MINLVIFGPPGAGKGTQAVKIAEKFNLHHISTGDVFRRNLKGETELGKLAKTFLDKGDLVPDEVTINMLKDEVDSNMDKSGFIFDGFPRNTNQATALDAFLAQKDSKINAMLALEVADDELRVRLAERAKTSGRVDDADPKIIQNRIDTYHNETKPVKDFYTVQNKAHLINGIGEIDQITAVLLETVNKVI